MFSDLETLVEHRAASRIAAEFLTNLIEKALRLRQDRGILSGRKITENLLLFLAELAGNLNQNLH